MSDGQEEDEEVFNHEEVFNLEGKVKDEDSPRRGGGGGLERNVEKREEGA